MTEEIQTLRAASAADSFVRDDSRLIERDEAGKGETDGVIYWPARRADTESSLCVHRDAIDAEVMKIAPKSRMPRASVRLKYCSDSWPHSDSRTGRPIPPDIPPPSFEGG